MNISYFPTCGPSQNKVQEGSCPASPAAGVFLLKQGKTRTAVLPLWFTFKFWTQAVSSHHCYSFRRSQADSKKEKLLDSSQQRDNQSQERRWKSLNRKLQWKPQTCRAGTRRRLPGPLRHLLFSCFSSVCPCPSAVTESSPRNQVSCSHSWNQSLQKTDGNRITSMSRRKRFRSQTQRGRVLVFSSNPVGHTFMFRVWFWKWRVSRNVYRVRKVRPADLLVKQKTTSDLPECVWANGTNEDFGDSWREKLLHKYSLSSPDCCSLFTVSDVFCAILHLFIFSINYCSDWLETFSINLLHAGSPADLNLRLSDHIRSVFIL